MLINYTMWCSNLFFCIQLFPTFFIVQAFHSPDFSRSTFFRVQRFLGPGCSESRFFWVQIFQGPGFSGPGFSGSRFFRVQVFLGPGSGSGSRVWVQVLIVAEIKGETLLYIESTNLHFIMFS